MAGRRPRTYQTALSPAFLVRMALLACVAVVGSAWGLVRFYTHARASMVVRVAVGMDGGAWDAGAGMIEIEVQGR